MVFVVLDDNLYCWRKYRDLVTLHALSTSLFFPSLRLPAGFLLNPSLKCSVTIHPPTCSFICSHLHSSIRASIHPSNGCLVRMYYISDTILATADTAVNNKDKNLFIHTHTHNVFCYTCIFFN